LNYLVTGAAGFIGYHVCERLLQSKGTVYGMDNLNPYYDVDLKKLRLSKLQVFDKFKFNFCNLQNFEQMSEYWRAAKPDIVIHLAAQAGVRYSIENPDAYLQSNIVGFQHILELARKFPVQNLVYASSSSVYGLNNSPPYQESQALLAPASYYAATKISNEAAAASYSYLYNINSVGLRFFTVYGPYGRPDMALFKFCRLMLNGEPIEIYNQGNLTRDWTYVDDIVSGVLKASELRKSHSVYNLGKGSPDQLMDAIAYLEEFLEVKALKTFLPMQMGDVFATHANIDKARTELGFKPEITLRQGVRKFVDWVLTHRQFLK
jgi:UDP-glucuronate 4-epimerase